MVTVLLLVLGSLCERRWGSLKMLWMTLLVQIVGVALGRRPGRAVPTHCSTGRGPSTWPTTSRSAPPRLIAGLLMAYSGGLSALWRRRIRIGVLTVCLVAMLYGGQLQDVLRMSTALVGLLAGALFLHTGDRQLVGARESAGNPGAGGGCRRGHRPRADPGGDHRRGARVRCRRWPTCMSGPTPIPTPARTGTSPTS